MAKVSPIFNEATYDKLKEIFESKKASWGKVCEIFTMYLISQDALFCNVPNNESYRGEKNLTKYIKDNWKKTLKAYSLKKHG